MRGDWMDQARRFEDIDKAALRKIERKERREAMDWPHTPTAAELEDLNKLRDYHGLPRIEKITRASEWFRACFEIDDCAEAGTPNIGVTGDAGGGVQ